MKHIAGWVLLLILAGAGTAFAQYFDCPNKIGIYTSPTPTDATAADQANYFGAPGVVNAYVVISNPTNFHTGSPSSDIVTPIDIIGGFEFRLVVPADVFVLASNFQPGSATTNFLTPPNFLAGCNIPVVNGTAWVVNVQFGWFSGLPRTIALAPVEPANVQSVPGMLALTDFSDDFRLNSATSISGDFAMPVFGLGTSVALAPCVVDPIDPTWSVDVTSGAEAVVVGADAGASDTFDYDYDEVDYDTGLTMLRPEWGLSYTQFSRDIRAAYDLQAEFKSWEFTVTTPAAPDGEMVTLGFAPTFSSAEGVGLALTDQATGLKLSLFPDLVYHYSTAGGSRTFTLDVGAVPAPYAPVEISVAAAANGLGDAGNLAMVAAVATDGYDSGIDLPEPTPPPAGYVALSFEHDGWPLGPRFRRDVMGEYDPLTGTRTWPLMVETDQAGPVTLTFAPNFDEASHIALMLRDLQSGQTFSMFPDLTYIFDSPGAGVYRFEMLVGGVPTPPLTPEARTLSSGWSLVGLPLQPTGAANLDDVLLGQVPGYGYAFDFSAAAGYTMLDGETEAQLGKGYWLATDTGFAWTMTGEIAYETVSIPLAVGWNLVGYPLWFPAPVEGIRVTAGGVTLPWNDALLLNWVSGVMDYDQVQDDYTGTLDLSAWHGYWVAAMQPGVSLSYSWPNFLDPPLRFTKSAIEEPAPADRWRTVLTLDDGAGHLRTASLGADASATDGFDAVHDLPRPPSTPSGGASLVLLRPEWKLPSGDALASDIVAPLAGRDMSWRLRVRPYRAGTMTLSWSNRRWPEGQDFELYNVSENRVVARSMRDLDRVTLSVGTQALDLIVRNPGQLSGVGDDVPFAGYELGVHPNPFNPATTVTFALPREGRTEVRIYSVRGELVDVLGGDVLGAGPQQFTWRGTDRAGRSVPSGSYFARLMVDGRHVGETAKMSLVR